MKMDIAPKTDLGKWSIALNALFLIVITISIVLVKVFGMLSFDDHWWDVTVPVIFSASIIALFTGIKSVRKNKERSVLVYMSIVISICVIIFLLLHSLFISD
jgi:hypothetical protein